MNLRSPNSGFTLLEVLISIVLLVMISLSVYQATTQTYRLRDVLMNEGDFHNGIRLAMGILDRDISMLYSPIMILPEKKAIQPPTEAADLNVMMSGELGRSTQYWLGATDRTGIRASRFIGSDSKISFISASHLRLYKDSTESELTKVSIELEEDKRREPEATREGKVLVKTASPNAFDDDDSRDKMKQSYPLLRGVTRFRFRFYRKDKKQWLNSWDSDSADLKNKYPDQIELSIEVKGPSRMFFEGTYHFRPEIPIDGINPSI